MRCSGTSAATASRWRLPSRVWQCCSHFDPVGTWSRLEPHELAGFRPPIRIHHDVPSGGIQFAVAPDHAVIVVALPDPLARRALYFIDSLRRGGLERADDGTQRAG